MKKICFLIAVLAFFSGCSKQTPVQTIVDTTEQSINALERNLPKECKIESVLAQIDSLRSQNQAVKVVCETQLENAELKYKQILTILVAVCVLFLAFLVKKIIK